jgi:hypothetical protein
VKEMLTEPLLRMKGGEGARLMLLFLVSQRRLAVPVVFG